MLSKSMGESTLQIPKRRPGRPATGKGQQIIVRMHPPMLAELDAWMLRHNVKNHGGYSRPEAVRRLLATILSPSSR
jgi:hypothetical protein